MRSDRAPANLTALACLVLLALTVPGWSLADERLRLVGGPFEIRSAFTDFNPHYLALSRSRDSGSFVAVWDESPIGFWTVRARRFGPSGLPLDSAPLEVTPAGTTFVYAPAQVASDAAGGFVVAWSGRVGNDPWNIWGRWYSPTGAPASAERRMNAPTSALLDEPTVAMAADGRSVAAWTDWTNGGVWFQSYDPAGDTLLAGDHPLPIEGVGAYDFFEPTVSIDPGSGTFVVVRRTRQGPSPADPACTNFRFGVDLVGQLFSESGEPIGTPFYPLPPQPGAYRLPLVSLAPLGNGEFVAAWALGNCFGSATVAPTARVIHADGTLSAPFPLSSSGVRPSVAADAQGRFAAAWSGAAGSLVRRFERNGAPLGEEVLAVPMDATGSAGAPLLASDGAGRLVVAWQTSRDVPTPYGTANEHRFLGQLLAPDTVRRVSIDIRPGSPTNPINLGSNGVVPVAIRSAEGFDAASVDPTTVSLASAQVKLRGNGTPMASRVDVDGDGLEDLVVQVSTSALVLAASDTTATLEGSTYDGQRIEGTDAVRVVQ
ncbi:MAG: hypothetical protein U0599_14710 [Vicinamibacteria bacterium]